MSETPRSDDLQEVGRATSLYEAIEAIISQTELPGAQQSLVDRAAALLGARWAGLWLLDGKSGAVAPAALYPRPKDGPPKGDGHHPAQELVSKAARSRQTVANEEGLAVPVQRQGRLLGVLAAGARVADAPLGDEQRALLSLLAAQAALLVENARVHERELQVRQEKDEFVSIVSHEFKTPLTAIKGFAQLAVRRLGERADEATLKYLQTIDQQATRLARFANDVVTYSRLESGQLPMATVPVDLVAVVRRVVEATRATADRHTLCLDTDEASLAFVGDPDRLCQVVSTLLGNAVKYSPEGGEVQVNVRRNGGDAVLSVRDRGIGMGAEQREQLFRRFYRGDQAMAMGEGTGLSLAIARGIVEAHGGRIWVESEPERGSTFYLSLPISD